MPTLDNGGWVPDDHPLYLDEQQRKKTAAPGVPREISSAPYDPNNPPPSGVTDIQQPDGSWITPQAGQGMTREQYAAAYPGQTSMSQDLASTGATMPWAYSTQATPGAGTSIAAPPSTPMMVQPDGSAGHGTPAPAAAAPAADMTPQAANAAGLGWVPRDHPLYGTPGFVGSAAAGGAAGAPGGTPAGAPGSTYVPPNLAPGTPGSSAVDTQNSNAQTYSATPGAAPTANTTNQGTQDVVRNQYLQSIQKGTNIDTNDPNFRMQSDAFSAAQERSRRNAADDISQSNFAGGTRGSGAQALETRAANEVAQRNVGSFEAGLVGQELQGRRAEIQNALSSLGGMISSDQQGALQRELAALDAALKRESLAQTGRMGEADLNLRSQLGTGALNVDMMRALLQNQQFNGELGFNISNADLQARMRAMGL